MYYLPAVSLTLATGLNVARINAPRITPKEEIIFKHPLGHFQSDVEEVKLDNED